jgi:hypothetical protein
VSCDRLSEAVVVFSNGRPHQRDADFRAGPIADFVAEFIADLVADFVAGFFETFFVSFFARFVVSFLVTSLVAARWADAFLPAALAETEGSDAARSFSRFFASVFEIIPPCALATLKARAMSARTSSSVSPRRGFTATHDFPDM